MKTKKAVAKKSKKIITGFLTMNGEDRAETNGMEAEMADAVINRSPTVRSHDQLMAIKAAVNGVYDIQKLRIATGNRLVIQFKVKMGYEIGTKEEDAEDVFKDMLENLRNAYKLLATGAAKEMPKKDEFVGNVLISEYAEMVMVGQYLQLEIQEEQQMNLVKSLIEDHPIWVHFLKDVPGCGPAMAGAIISQIDISKARYVSSLWKYCGYDVVTSFRSRTKNSKGEYSYAASFGAMNDIELEGLIGEALEDVPSAVYLKEGAETEEISQWDIVNEGRSKKTHHLVPKSLERDGKVKEWKGASFNPWLKSKMWVLAGCMLKAGIRWPEVSQEEYDLLPEGQRMLRDKTVNRVTRKNVPCKLVCTSKYPVIYLNYRNRLSQKPDWQKETGMHLFNASIRYMIKIFLKDLYNAWRPLEGLEVAPTYEEAKLGLKHRD